MSNHVVAEDVTQDTWLAVLRGLDGFAERSTFRTWLLKILVNRAMSTGVREHRSVAIGDAAPAVEASRFDASGAWMAAPEHWVEGSDDRLSAAALRTLLRRQRRRFEAHLRGCENCTAYLDPMRETIGVTGQLRAEDLTLEMREEFMSPFRRWHSEEN